MSNFWRSLDFLLINCEIKLDLSWSKECIVSEINKTPEVIDNPDANSPDPLIKATTETSATIQINNAKLFVPVVTLCLLIIISNF